MLNENKPLPRRKPNQVDIVSNYRHVREFLKKIKNLKYANYVITIGVISLALGLIYIGDSIAYNGRIHQGVNIDNVDLSNLSRQEARTKLQKAYKNLPEKQLTIEYKNKKWQVKPADFKVKINIDKSINSAFQYGRSGSLLTIVVSRIKAFKGISFKGIFNYNHKRFGRYVRKVIYSAGVKPNDAGIEIKNGQPVVIKSKSGHGLEYKSTYQLIINKLSSLKNKKLQLITNELVPKVSNEEAEKSLKLAKSMISKNIIVRFKGKRYILTKNELMYAFTSKPLNDNSLNLYFYPEKIQDNLSPKVKEIYTDPVSATFIVDGSNVSVTQSQMGQEVDFVKTAKRVTQAAKSKNDSVLLAVIFTKPKRTTEEAKKMGIKTLVSSFTTNYPAGKPRVKNIHRGAEILDKKLIAPGTTFSFNKYVGQRTTEAGFVAAPEIRDGEFVDTVGGGVCQVSTTFFNVILLGGYPVGERSPHSLYIKKYPNGRDSAVSWTKPDLTFTNDTDAWILIKSGYTATSVTFNFYSTDYGREVTFDTRFKGWNKFPTEVVKDKMLEKGKEKLKQAGKNGPRYEVTRTVTQNGKVIRENTFSSSYRPTKRIIIKGTKEPPKEEEKKEEEDASQSTDNSQQSEDR